MKEQERLDAVCAFLEERSFASVRDLKAHLGVSAATVRRDIDKLNGLGRLRKVYGGASARNDMDDKLSARPFAENADLAIHAKSAIALAASGLVNDGDRIILNAGTSVYAFAKLIARRPLNVYTNSVPIVSHLSDAGACTVTVAGGELHREPGLIFEPNTDQAIPFFASRLFTGAQGICNEGLLESHPMLIRVVQQLTSWSDEVIVLVDSRKFGIKPRHVALPLQRIHTVVTDSNLRDQDATMLEREGIALIIADVVEG